MAAVEKWGDGLAVRIPENLAEVLAVGEGTQIDLEFQAGALVMRPTSQPKRRLSEMLDGITPANLHEACDFGPDVGAEMAE